LSRAGERADEAASRQVAQADPGDPLVALTQDLVRIPSENPPGDTRAVCAALGVYLKEAGFALEFFEPEAGFASLLAIYEFERPGATLLLCGHVDVVPALAGSGRWSRDPWGGEIEGGRLYGRGSLDMKGPLAALVLAATEVARSEVPLSGRLVVAAVADEERGGRRGSGALVQAGKIRADAALIAEPGDRRVVVAHRGMCFVEIRTKGRSGHASVPEHGVNAVELMVEVLTACRSLTLRHEPHPLLGSPTVAVTTIDGGENANVIPDLCRATFDVRKVPGMSDVTVKEDIVEHLERAGFGNPAQVEVRILASGEPGETAPDAGVVEIAVRAFEREFGHPPEVGGTAAATDGWWFSQSGIPTVMALGPGGIAGCHIADEFVDIEELRSYARIYTDIIANFLSVPELA
jgi:acetylornithine deacetylase/succinyl-diaminopimelate desuccinylase family protein